MAEYIYGIDEHSGHWLTDTEIVRCKDCVDFQYGTCLEHETGVSPDGFCSWGERKVEGECLEQLQLIKEENNG